MDQHERYIPALGRHWLTPLYDPVLKWVIQEARFKSHLVKQAHIQTGQRVLDLGCGTATLTILIKQTYPGAEVIGLDGDPEVLEIARRKAAQAGLGINFQRALAFHLPYREHAFDRVLSSLVLHHLTTENKQRALHEVLRILQPGGEVHIADLGKPHTALAYLISCAAQRFEEVADNVQGLLPAMLWNAGFDHVEEYAHYMTVVGTLALYRARKPK